LRELDIAEGLTVQWEDTLCKRALDSGQLACSSVPQRWADSTAAASLHIQSYVSAPVSNADGQLLGTLCAASTRTVQITEQVEALFRLFANIVGNFIEREVLMEKLQAANDQLTARPDRPADRTAQSPRHGGRAGAPAGQAERSGVTTLVGVIDLDGFKQINDRYGHQGGDEFLQAIARRVQGGLRGSDLIGRLGGDEFLFIGPGPQQGDPQHAAQRTRQRLEQLIAGHYQLGEHRLDYAGASVGVVALRRSAGRWRPPSSRPIP
jgi:diguanylate cyclase